MAANLDRDGDDVIGNAAGVVDAEHVQRAAERDPRADAHREVEDLGVGVRGVQAGEEVVVDRVGESSANRSAYSIASRSRSE